VIYFHSKTLSPIEDALTKDLDLLSNLLEENEIDRNKGKTEIILFGTSIRLSKLSKLNQDINIVH
jgi:hypothetical protein